MKTKTTKDGLDSYPSSSSAAAEAQEDSVEVEPVRKSARVSKRRYVLVTQIIINQRIHPNPALLLIFFLSFSLSERLSNLRLPMSSQRLPLEQRLTPRLGVPVLKKGMPNLKTQ